MIFLHHLTKKCFVFILSSHEFDTYLVLYCCFYCYNRLILFLHFTYLFYMTLLPIKMFEATWPHWNRAKHTRVYLWPIHMFLYWRWVSPDINLRSSLALRHQSSYYLIAASQLHMCFSHIHVWGSYCLLSVNELCLKLWCVWL